MGQAVLIMDIIILCGWAQHHAPMELKKTKGKRFRKNPCKYTS